ncbi:MAG: manganese efflux pump MntP family protein [Bacillota bacterium]|nr:manganese efflux pump MntP family protein [Bacillota bacterium]
MGIMEIVLIGLGLSMDAAAVSMSNGMCGKQIKLSKAIEIALLFGIFQGIMPAIGYFGGELFEDQIKAIDHWIALILLAAIGGKMIYEATRPQSKETKQMELSTGVLLVQAIATSIDALAVGIGFAVLSINIYFAGSMIALITFICSLASVYIGKRFGAILSNKAEILGGVILISIGAKIFIEHMFFNG